MKHKKIIKKIIIIVILIIVSFLFVFYQLFFSMSHLPKGELVYTTQCDNCGKTINLYLFNGGATTDYAIRGELVYKNGYKKNIYWSYHESETDVSWISCDEVDINGHKLNVNRDRYDWRRE